MILCVESRLILKRSFPGSFVDKINLGIEKSFLLTTLSKTLPTEIQAIHFGSFSLAHEPIASTLEKLIEREHHQRIISIDPNIRPSFTVGWPSTVLCESLRCGVIPILLEADITTLPIDRNKSHFTHENIQDLYISGLPHIWGIYPFKKRSFSWEEEKERIFDLLEDNSLYKKTLSELRMR